MELHVSNDNFVLTPIGYCATSVTCPSLVVYKLLHLVIPGRIPDTVALIEIIKENHR